MRPLRPIVGFPPLLTSLIMRRRRLFRIVNVHRDTLETTSSLKLHTAGNSRPFGKRIRKGALCADIFVMVARPCFVRSPHLVAGAPIRRGYRAAVLDPAADLVLAGQVLVRRGANLS